MGFDIFFVGILCVLNRVFEKGIRNCTENFVSTQTTDTSHSASRTSMEFVRRPAPASKYDWEFDNGPDQAEAMVNETKSLVQ